MTEARKYCEAFIVIINLVMAMKAEPLNQYEGCWETDIDDCWHIAVNGNDVQKLSSDETPVDPYCAFVSYNGFPAGLIYPNGGTMVVGAAANEDAFIDAVKKKIEEIKAE